MKKILILTVGIVGFYSLVSYATTQQYNSIGNVQMSTSTMSGALAVYALPKATIAALIPGTSYWTVICTNCTGGNAGKPNLCIASGTVNAGDFMMTSTATTTLGCQ